MFAWFLLFISPYLGLLIFVLITLKTHLGRRHFHIIFIILFLLFIGSLKIIIGGAWWSLETYVPINPIVDAIIKCYINLFMYLVNWEVIVNPSTTPAYISLLVIEATFWGFIGYLISRKLSVIAERRKGNMRECLIMREFMMLRINNIMFILYCLIILLKGDFVWFFTISLIFFLTFVFPGFMELLLHKPKYIKWARKSFPEYKPLRRIKFYKKTLPKILISSLILGISAIFTFIIRDKLTLYLLLGKFFAFLSGMNLGISFSIKKILSDEE